MGVAPLRFPSTAARRFAAKFAIDLALWTIASPIAFALRLEDRFRESLGLVALYTLVAVPIGAVAIYGFDLHRQTWRKVGVGDLRDLVYASAFAGAVMVGIGLAMHTGGLGMPRTVPVIATGVALLLMASGRLAARLAFERTTLRDSDAARTRVLVAGAGEAGTMVVREMQRHPESGLQPVAFVDDERNKQRRRHLGLEVVGSLDDIPMVVRNGRIDEVLIAMPSAPGTTVRRVVDRAREADVRYRILPGVFELLTGKVGLAEIREVQLEDLLRREAVELHGAEVEATIAGRSILVTGAGGSIGSELVRQVAKLGPARVILVGQGENSLDAIHREVRLAWPELECHAVVGSIRDEQKMDRVFARFEPDVVYHAAAHKHVPMMERDPDEAVLNNVGGTKVVAESALRHGTTRFVNISTDKAVEPRSVLGATKLLAERLVRELSKQAVPGQAFVSVRFGNVLGSRGSVVPLFTEQIRRGGPVTITDPAMTRYLMTIPEASQLVVQASALADNGALYVLDMGEPVRMVDLAQDLIQLMGYRPGTDIEIVTTGVRPGEKLHESLFAAEERCVATSHDKILIAEPTSDLGSAFWPRVDRLLSEAHGRQLGPLFITLSELEPSYQPRDLSPDRAITSLSPSASRRLLRSGSSEQMHERTTPDRDEETKAGSERNPR